MARWLCNFGECRASGIWDSADALQFAYAYMKCVRVGAARRTPDKSLVATPERAYVCCRCARVWSARRLWMGVLARARTYRQFAICNIIRIL